MFNQKPVSAGLETLINGNVLINEADSFKSVNSLKDKNQFQILKALSNFSLKDALCEFNTYLVDKFNDELYYGWKYDGVKKKLFKDSSQSTSKLPFCYTVFRNFEVPHINDLVNVILMFEKIKKGVFINFYELIQIGPRKIYIDIDLERKEYEKISDKYPDFILFGEILKDQIILNLTEYFKSKNITLDLSQDILLYTSHGPNKRSYHILVDNYCFNDHQEVGDIIFNVQQSLPEEMRKFLDLSIYKSIQAFRTLYSCKENSYLDNNVRFKTFQTEWCYFDQTIRYKYRNDEIRLMDEFSKNRSELDRKKLLMKINLQHAQVSCVQTYYPLQYMSHMVSEKYIERHNKKYSNVEFETITGGVEPQKSNIFKLFNEKLPELKNVYVLQDTSEGLIGLKRKRSAHCPQCRRIHDNVGAYISVIGLHGDVFFKCHRARDYGIDKSIFLGTLFPELKKKVEQNISPEIIQKVNGIGNTTEIIISESQEDNKILENITLLIQGVSETQEKDPNRFTVAQLKTIILSFQPEHILDNESWIYLSMMIFSCCFKMLPKEDKAEIYKIWFEWGFNFPLFKEIYNNYDLSGRETCFKFIGDLWSVLSTYSQNKFTSIELLNWFKEVNPEYFNAFIRKNRGVKTFIYHPIKYTLKDDKKVKVDRYTEPKIKMFDINKPVELIWSKMDTYKTRSLIQFIVEHPEMKWILYPTSRFATAQDAKETLGETGREIVFYTDINKHLNDDGILNEKVIIIIQMESLRKLEYINHAGNKFKLIGKPDLLVLDECTSCCAQISSVTMNGREDSLNLFGHYIQTAGKIIAMDADIDARIVDLLKDLRPDTIHVQQNELKYEGRTMFRYHNRDKALFKLRERLVNGEKIFIICSTKADAHCFESELSGLYKVRCHTSKTSVNDKEELCKVNCLWTKYQVVIITSTITNGVNFCEEHFDSMFIFAANGELAPVRDIKQMSGRVRKISTQNIHTYLTVKNYKCTVSYNKIKQQVFNSSDNYKKQLKNVNDDENSGGNVKQLTVEALAKFQPKFIINDGPGEVIEEDNWITRTHILNIQERNRSKRFFEEEFEFMFEQQGVQIVQNYDEITPEEINWLVSEEEKKLLELQTQQDDEIQEIIPIELREQDFYEKNEVISGETAFEIRQKIDSREATQEETQKYQIYSTVKYFKEKPDYENYKFFENHSDVFINTLVESSDDQNIVETILKMDRNKFVHRNIVNGKLAKWMTMKEFCQMLDIENTSDPFTFDTDVLTNKTLQNNKLIKTFKDEWLKWIHKAQVDFGFEPMEIKSEQVFIERLRRIFKSWTGVNFGAGIRKKHTYSRKRYDVSVYNTSLPDKFIEIKPLLKPWGIEFSNTNILDVPDPTQDKVRYFEKNRTLKWVKRNLPNPELISQIENLPEQESKEILISLFPELEETLDSLFDKDIDEHTIYRIMFELKPSCSIYNSDSTLNYPVLRKLVKKLKPSDTNIILE